MTTNVYDQAKNVVATDSRWSYSVKGKTGLDLPDITGFVDDTGFDKIVFDDTAAFMFAGPGELISLWRDAILQRSLGRSRPGVARNFAICMVRRADGEVVHEHGQKIAGALFRFAGTGAEPAYECWKQNQDPRKAVLSAQLKDRASGGDVRYLERDTWSHNLDFSKPFAVIAEKFLEKGRIMYTNQSIPVAEAVKTDPRAQEFVGRVKAGTIQAEAPSGYDPVIWTPDDEARLDKALADHYGTQKK
jgi:hypothetical protein